MKRDRNKRKKWCSGRKARDDGEEKKRELKRGKKNQRESEWHTDSDIQKEREREREYEKECV